MHFKAGRKIIRPAQRSSDQVAVRCLRPATRSHDATNAAADVVVSVARDASLHAEAKARMLNASAQLNILLIWVDSVSEHDGMADRTMPETLAATARVGRTAYRFRRFQALRTWTDPNFVAAMTGE
eukprot:SAG11_NODE_12981_length_676_cov_0.620451_2_plen_126_part_00